MNVKYVIWKRKSKVGYWYKKQDTEFHAIEYRRALHETVNGTRGVEYILHHKLSLRRDEQIYPPLPLT